MKKLLSLLLISVLIVGLLASCGTAGQTSDTSQQDASTTSAEESGDIVYKANVPEVDYKKLKFKILTTAFSEPTDSEFGYGEELEDGVVNTAIQERNAKVNELLNIEIVEELIVDEVRFAGGKVNDRVRLTMQTGQDDFYLVVPSLYNCGALSAAGTLRDLKSLEVMDDLSAPWWDQNFIEDLTVADKMFFITGDLSIITRNSLTVCFFNKKMFTDNGLDNPYQLVKDNKWTFDKLVEFSKTIKSDDNNDNKIDYTDTFGVGGQNDLAWAMFYGAGERIASMGSDGYPQLTMYNTRSTGVLDKMLELMTNDDYFVNSNDYFSVSPTPSRLLSQAFIENRALIFCEALGIVEDLRQMAVGTDFGILPIPLYDEEQTQYQHMVNPWSGNAVAIPAYLTEEDAEMAAIVLQVLGAESKNFITPAYYDRALKKQTASDRESQEMLDIIFSGVGADMGHIYNWGQLGAKVLHYSVDNKAVGQFRSLYEANQSIAQEALDTTVEAFKNLES